VARFPGTPRGDFAWREVKEDPARGGAFATLPVLDWDGFVLGETLPIAGYLARRLGIHEGRTDEQLALLENVTAAAYLNVLALVSDLLAPFPTPGDDQWPGFLDAFIEEMPVRVARFERAMDAPYFGGDRPAVPDYFVFEGIQMWRELLGAPVEQTLSRCPRLRALLAALAQRPGIAAHLASGQHQPTITASPQEPAIRERLRERVAAQKR
jgi:glutathione S-transferase